jgi:hypothetical protein
MSKAAQPLKFRGADADGYQIDAGDSKVTIRKLRDFPKRRALGIEADAATHPQHPFGDGAVRRVETGQEAGDR